MRHNNKKARTTHANDVESLNISKTFSGTNIQRPTYERNKSRVLRFERVEGCIGHDVLQLDGDGFCGGGHMSRGRHKSCTWHSLHVQLYMVGIPILTMVQYQQTSSSVGCS